jgi:uncharacterized protein YjgD (DUF1641 family)
MTNEKEILERLSHLESQLDFLVKPARKTQELKEDLTPLMNQGIALAINELLDVGSSFELSDLLELIKQTMRSTTNLHYALRQLDNIIEFISDIEPLLRSAVPQLISYLDDLEKRGVLRIIKSTLDIRAKVAKAYSPEDMDAVGDGFVTLLGFSRKLTDPETVEFIDKLMSIPGSVDLKNAQSAGVGTLLTAGFNTEIKAGLGVMLELTKAMGKLKS